MYEFKCRDMGMDCDFAATAASADAAMAKAMAHAKEVHGEMLSTMSPEQKAGMDKQLSMAVKAI